MTILIRGQKLFRISVQYDSQYTGMSKQNGLLKTGASKSFNGKKAPQNIAG